MPSTEAESFGLVAVEAMMAKKPVIGSNHGGLTEIIVNNKTGLLFEPNNENELAQSIQYLINNPKIRIEMGEKGQQRAMEAFSIESYIKNFQELFLKFKQVNTILIKANANLEQANANLEQANANFEQANANFEQANANFEQASVNLEQASANLEQVIANLEQVIANLEQAIANINKKKQ